MAHRILFKKNGFTLVEVLISAFVMALVLSAAWAIYILGWTWWYEVSPRIEAQRIARLAMEKIVEGVPDPTTGFDMVGGSRYNKRNGIAGTYYFHPTLPNTYVNSEGTTVSHEIDYGLSVDYTTYPPASACNIRSFYLGTDPATGLKAVYYKDSSGTSHILRETLGITNLEFSYMDPSDPLKDVIVVSVTVEKDVAGVGPTPYHIRVHYGYDDTATLSCGNTVYLRNVQQ